jgi:ABC-type multidrug transport system fused ATPase/permease subunit
MLSKIHKLFPGFFYFYNFLGIKIFVSFIFSLCVGILDGFGFSMFFPLLETSSKPNSDKNSEFKFLYNLFDILGFQLNIINILTFIMVFFIFKGVIKYIAINYRVRLQLYFMKGISLKLLKSLNRISFSKFVNSDSGRIQNTMTTEIDRVSFGYINYFSALEQAILIVVYLSFALIINWKFTILLIVSASAANLLYKNLYRQTKNTSIELTNNFNNYQGQIIQYVSNYKYLKSTGFVNKYSTKLELSINKIERDRKKIGLLTGTLEAIREPILIIIIVSLIFIQIKILNGQLSVIIVSLLFLYRAINSMTSLQSYWNKYISVTGSMNNLEQLQIELDNNSEFCSNHSYNGFKKSFKLENITLSLGGKRIFNNLTLEFDKNKTIALVGESGSGKTTILNLLTGIIKPDAGRVLVDGVDINVYDSLQYRNQFGYISQDPVIFNDTIFNNITFWDDFNDSNFKKFESAICKASLSDFVTNLAFKQETILGSSGINISGGQKQRISIARELYKNPNILIMDEATSALDSETENIIRENIDNLKGHHTILIIAHRLSTIKNVDSIFYLNKNGVIAKGSYSELYELSGEFRKMVHLQEL